MNLKSLSSIFIHISIFVLISRTNSLPMKKLSKHSSRTNRQNFNDGISTKSTARPLLERKLYMCQHQRNLTEQISNKIQPLAQRTPPMLRHQNLLPMKSVSQSQQVGKVQKITWHTQYQVFTIRSQTWMMMDLFISK